MASVEIQAESGDMGKCVSLALFWAGVCLAQIPERNCMSNPFMAGCPATEESRKMQELIDKGVVTPKPVDLNLPRRPLPVVRKGLCRRMSPIRIGNVRDSGHHSLRTGRAGSSLPP